MNYKEILKHYQTYDNILDDQLLDEAIASLEQSFSYMNGDKLLHKCRPQAIAYLALLNIKENGI